MGKLLLKLILLFFMAGISYAEPHAFPVPFVASNPNHDLIRFTDLPGAGTIKIFSVSGEKIRELSINPGDLLKPWDLKNDSGKDVVTGVYLYLIESGASQTKGKIVVIR